jgi:hypothetical protein
MNSKEKSSDSVGRIEVGQFRMQWQGPQETENFLTTAFTVSLSRSTMLSWISWLAMFHLR